MGLFGSKSFLVVDIGTTSIKIGEFVHRDDAVEIVNYGFLESRAHLDRSGSAIQTSSFRMLEPLVEEYIKSILKSMGTKARHALVSLPSFTAFTTLIELPKMSHKDTESAVPFQSQQYIPAPLSTVEIDWSVVGERADQYGNDMQQIFLTSISRTTLQKYDRVMKATRLKIIDREIENVSLARVATLGTADPALIIDIGSRSTSFGVAENGTLKFASQTDFAGSSITQVLATGLNITLSRAEALKIQRGLARTGGEQGLSTLMTPILDAIISEAVRALHNFERNFQRKPTRAVLSGGSARLFGLQEYFAERLNMPVEMMRPFDHIYYPQALSPFLSELSPRFAVMLGLALKPEK